MAARFQPLEESSTTVRPPVSCWAAPAHRAARAVDEMLEVTRAPRRLAPPRRRVRRASGGSRRPRRRRAARAWLRWSDPDAARVLSNVGVVALSAGLVGRDLAVQRDLRRVGEDTLV